MHRANAVKDSHAKPSAAVPRDDRAVHQQGERVDRGARERVELAKEERLRWRAAPLERSSADGQKKEKKGERWNGGGGKGSGAKGQRLRRASEPEGGHGGVCASRSPPARSSGAGVCRSEGDPYFHSTIHAPGEVRGVLFYHSETWQEEAAGGALRTRGTDLSGPVYAACKHGETHELLNRD